MWRTKNQLFGMNQTLIQYWDKMMRQLGGIVTNIAIHSPSAPPLEEIDDCLNETIMISNGVILATPIGKPMAMETLPMHEIESQE